MRLPGLCRERSETWLYLLFVLLLVALMGCEGTKKVDSVPSSIVEYKIG